MKNFLFLVISLAITSVALANRPPGWIKHPPKAGNDTYIYMVQRGDGRSEDEAMIDALHRINRRVAYRLGLPFTSKNVSIYSPNNIDDSNEPVEIYNIPINHVCDYTEYNKGKWHVYLLCQVAVSGDIEPDFDEYRECGCNSAYLGEESRVTISSERPGMPTGHEYYCGDGNIPNQFGVHTRRIMKLRND